MDNVVAIYAYDDTLLILTADGSLWQCGDACLGAFDQNGYPARMYETPVKVLENVRMPEYY